MKILENLQLSHLLAGRRPCFLLYQLKNDKFKRKHEFQIGSSISESKLTDPDENLK